MIRHRTRAKYRSAPSQASASGTRLGGQNDTQASSKSCKNMPHPQQPHQITPTFTWDIPTTHKQVIYDDLGVKEMSIGHAGHVSQAQTTKRTKISSKQPQSKACAANVKGHLVSPNHFKPHQEHIHDGQACSCKKQLLLEKPSDPFYFLSDEMMLGIFWWLPMRTLTHCAKVCKRWNHLAFDDTLWRRIDLSTKTFAAGILGRILQRGTVAAKLSRSSLHGPVFDDVSPESSVKVKRTTSRTSKYSRNKGDVSSKSALHLQYLDLTACDARPEQLLEILKRCPCNQIRKLSLESCAVNGDVMACVAKHGRSLEELNLCMCSGLKEAGLKAVLESCTKLQSLNLAWTGLSRKELDIFVECVPCSLEKLNLSGCRQVLGTADIVLLASRCPAMKELDLSDATAIGFSAIDAIVECMTELQHIALSRCYSIPRLSFVQLGALKCLRALDVFGLVQESEMLESMRELLPRVQINNYPFSAIARPTANKKRSNIWDIVCHE